MAAKKTSKKVAGKQTSPAQEALQITFVLMGNLKRAQLMYLFIARKLAEVRDRSLFAALGHKDMEDYAHQRLDLGRSSLYNYLHIYDWVKQAHPEWLGKNVKGKIPDLTDVANLMWIETTLAAPTLEPAKRVEAEALRKKALAGTLSRGELKDFKDTGKPVKDQVEALLSSLRSLRQKAGKIPGIPPEALSRLDAAINIMDNEKVMKVAGLHLIRPYQAA
jgi:hypothetical protein